MTRLPNGKTKWVGTFRCCPNARHPGHPNLLKSTDLELEAHSYKLTACLLSQIVAEGLHFGEGVGVSGALGGGEAGVEAADGFGDAAELGEGLCGHLIGGDVVGVVLDEGCEFGEGGVGVVLSCVFHREAVAREGVGGVELEDLVECGDLVHA